jgi:hypothetical protein
MTAPGGDPITLRQRQLILTAICLFALVTVLVPSVQASEQSRYAVIWNLETSSVLDGDIARYMLEEHPGVP